MSGTDADADTGYCANVGCENQPMAGEDYCEECTSVSPNLIEDTGTDADESVTDGETAIGHRSGALGHERCRRLGHRSHERARVNLGIGAVIHIPRMTDMVKSHTL